MWSELESVSTLPHMDKALSFLVVHGRQPDFSKDDGAVRGRCTTNLDEILLDREVDKLCVSHPCRARPHPGLMFVPVVARLHDL